MFYCKVYQREFKITFYLLCLVSNSQILTDSGQCSRNGDLEYVPDVIDTEKV